CLKDKTIRQKYAGEEDIYFFKSECSSKNVSSIGFNDSKRFCVGRRFASKSRARNERLKTYISSSRPLSFGIV
ncbi:MAG: hypothetical protein IJ220_09375, partial [Clostridia bacterium]|nr:hypothetical protein [Clostridia bacterium]